jgi:hypothetical protein
MSEVADKAQETVEQAREKGDSFNNIIATLVAVSATLMALCNVKDGNIVQAMAQAQANAVDTWSLYQSKGVKQHLLESTLEALTLQREFAVGLDAAKLARLDEKIKECALKVSKYESDKAKAEAQARAFEKQYSDLNVHDDQFDATEALLSLSLALYCVSALTRRRWLLAVAAAFTACGTIMALAGFLGWSTHPDWLARLLG